MAARYTGPTFFYGHGSWIALVVFFGLVAMRSFSSQRRHRGRQGSSSASPFAGSGVPRHAPDSLDAPSAGVTFTGIAPGWLTDPTGRHEQRYWSGSEWTEHVTDGGVPGTDPPPRDLGRGSTTSD